LLRVILILKLTLDLRGSAHEHNLAGVTLDLRSFKVLL